MNGNAPRPLDQLYAYLGWSQQVRGHKDFPFSSFEISISAGTGEVIVMYQFKNGEKGTLLDNRDQFPSPELVASLKMLAGPMDAIYSEINNRMAAWRKRRGRR
jgi:hypothetical protein